MGGGGSFGGGTLGSHDYKSLKLIIQHSKGVKLKKGLEAKWAMKKRAPGWLGFIRDYTTQLYRDFNKPL